MLLELLANVCAGGFAGAAVYVTFVEHPARLATGTPAAIREFGPSYHRGALMQASLAIVGFVAAIGGYLRSGSALVLAGGLLLVAPVPFTLIAIAPTNRRLLAPELDPGSA